MVDLTVHIGDIIVAASFIGAAWRLASKYGERVQNVENTVYGCERPPVEGLVNTVARHGDYLASHGMDRRHDPDRRHDTPLV